MTNFTPEIIANLTIAKAHQHLLNKDFTVADLVKACQQKIAETNSDINAYLTVFDNLDAEIAEAQKRFDNGTATPLTGIPLAIKDVIMIKGKRATGGSKILENYTATYSATAIEKLAEAGSIFIGKTNTDEFAQGGSTENSAYGVTKNPHDHTRVAGGSSGGSAAAVATDTALGALGSDTGGSIRLPASFCGVVGLKPTRGAVSRNGLMAMASSFDVIGPFAKTVEDAEIIYNAIKGIDPLDSTTVEATSKEATDTKVKKIGVPRSFLQKGIDDDILKNFEASLETLKKEGYEIVDIEIPYIEYSLAVYYILIPAEVSSNMARYDGIKYGERRGGANLLEQYSATRGELLGAEVKRRIMIGTYVLSAGYADQFYKKATEARSVITQSFKKVFENVDMIAMPVSPVPAFKIGEHTQSPLQMYLVDIFTVGANVSGVPAISIPSGTVDRDGKNLPVGLQLLAPHLHENALFSVGKQFESAHSGI